MSTTFYRNVKLENGEIFQIELNRDGFNVSNRNPSPYTMPFNAQRSSNFFEYTDEWHYQDGSDPENEFHKAIFKNERDVTEYMFWRIEKYLNRINREAAETKETNNGTE